jgi:hypothetical protein
MPRKCFICGKKDDPQNMFIDQLKATCKTPECMSKYSLWKVDKENKKRDKAERKELREKKAKLNETVPHWTKKAQKAFNRFIRLRDAKLPCVSCNKHASYSSYSATGSGWDCGHYRSVGSCSELRFCELNAHKQCVKCNQYKSGNVVEYRIELARRIGAAQLEWLEGPHELNRYRVEDLKEIEAKYKRKAKELENNRQ